MIELVGKVRKVMSRTAYRDGIRRVEIHVPAGESMYKDLQLPDEVLELDQEVKITIAPVENSVAVTK